MGLKPVALVLCRGRSSDPLRSVHETASNRPKKILEIDTPGETESKEPPQSVYLVRCLRPVQVTGIRSTRTGKRLDSSSGVGAM